MSRHGRPPPVTTAGMSHIAAITHRQAAEQQTYNQRLQYTEAPVQMSVGKGTIVWSCGTPLTTSNVKRTVKEFTRAAHTKPFFPGAPSTAEERRQANYTLMEFSRLLAERDRADFAQHLYRQEQHDAATAPLVEAVNVQDLVLAGIPQADMLRRTQEQNRLDELRRTLAAAQQRAPQPPLRHVGDLTRWLHARIDPVDKVRITNYTREMHMGLRPDQHFELTVEAIELSGKTPTPAVVMASLEEQILLRQQQHADAWEMFGAEAHHRRKNFATLVDKAMPQLRDLCRQLEADIPGNLELQTSSFLASAPMIFQQPQILGNSWDVNLGEEDTKSPAAHAIRMAAAASAEGGALSNSEEMSALFGAGGGRGDSSHATPTKRPRQELAAALGAADINTQPTAAPTLNFIAQIVQATVTCLHNRLVQDAAAYATSMQPRGAPVNTSGPTNAAVDPYSDTESDLYQPNSTTAQQSSSSSLPLALYPPPPQLPQALPSPYTSMPAGLPQPLAPPAAAAAWPAPPLCWRCQALFQMQWPFMHREDDYTQCAAACALAGLPLPLGAPALPPNWRARLGLF
eukprot:tig00001033_g6501.t1